MRRAGLVLLVAFTLFPFLWALLASFRPEAELFGGASLMPGDVKGPALGSRNVAEAFEFLERNEIAVLRHDVEGRQGRKLTFRTADGTTLIRKL